MAKTQSMSIRLNPDIKESAEAVYAHYGISLTDAINMFLHKSIDVGGLPFDLRPETPNSVTLAAMQESNDITRTKDGGYSDISDMLRDLKS